jgi:hypothetical protein
LTPIKTGLYYVRSLEGCRHVKSMVDGHPYKVEVVGSSPTVPTTKSQI